MNTIHQGHILKIAEKYNVNIRVNNNEVDVLLGHNTHILHGYKRDFVSMTGGWFYRDLELDIKFLNALISKYKIKKINFIGASKSCSGAVMLTKGLLRKGNKKVKYNLFLFSAYTTIDKDIYIKRNIIEKVPGTLSTLWESDWYTPELIKEMEARRLKNIKNVNIYLFFPGKSKYGEKQLAYRLEGDNFHHIELPVFMHNTLYPFWKKVQEDGTIEIYENEIKKMHKKDFDFYNAMQNNSYYKFDLYNCVENPKKFKDDLLEFIENYKKVKE